MSRMIWAGPNAGRAAKEGNQPTLEQLCRGRGGVKREQPDAGPTAARGVKLEDGVEHNNGTAQPPPTSFMNGTAAPAAAAASPYSREYMAEWAQQQQGADLTAIDDVIIQTLVPRLCPRDLFRGRAFFLNSCGPDPVITLFNLEKVIRFLGGTTVMGVSGKVQYVVAQHLASGKEAKAHGWGAPGAATKARAPPLVVHPHFVLECARQGRIVPEAPYRLRTARATAPVPGVQQRLQEGGSSHHTAEVQPPPLTPLDVADAQLEARAQAAVRNAAAVETLKSEATVVKREPLSKPPRASTAVPHVVEDSSDSDVIEL